VKFVPRVLKKCVAFCHQFSDSDKTIELLLPSQSQQEFQNSLDLQKVLIHNHSVLLKTCVVEHDYFTSKHYDAMMMVLDTKLKIQYEKDSVRFGSTEVKMAEIRGQSDKYLASPPNGVTVAREIYCRVVHSRRRLL